LTFFRVSEILKLFRLVFYRVKKKGRVEARGRRYWVAIGMHRPLHTLRPVTIEWGGTG